MDAGIAMLAGSISTIIFAGSVMPMVLKAVRTRDLASYSLGNLLLSNTGNVVHSIYVYSLPAGPIWVMHAFYMATTGIMLAMYLRHAAPRARLLHHLPHAARNMIHDFPDARRPAGHLPSNHQGGSGRQPSKEEPWAPFVKHHRRRPPRSNSTPRPPRPSSTASWAFSTTRRSPC